MVWMYLDDIAPAERNYTLLHSFKMDDDDDGIEHDPLEQRIDRLVQVRRNSVANALELRLSCTNLSIYETLDHKLHW